MRITLFRSIAALAALTAALASAQQKVNPNTQIQFPPSCYSTANAVYNAQTNTCISAFVASPVSFMGAWSPTTTYAVNNAVYFNGQQYVSLQKANHGQIPGQAPTYWAPLLGNGTGSGAASAPAFYSVSVQNGSPATPAATYTSAQASGLITACVFTTATSDPSTALTVDVKLAGVSILSGPQTIAAGTAAQTQTPLTLAGGFAPVKAGQVWEFDITGGAPAWTGNLDCRGPAAQTVAFIQGDGTTDNTGAIQAAVNGCTVDCTIQLSNVVITGQVTVPTAHSYDFIATGPVRCASGSTCFYRTSSTQVLTRMRFQNITFTGAGGKVIWDNLAFDSGDNGGIDVVGCHFVNVANGVVDVALSGGKTTQIRGSVFDTAAGLSAVYALESVVNNIGGVDIVSTPMQVNIDSNYFNGGAVFNVLQLNTSAAGDPGEGFLWHQNHFTSSSLTVTGNEWSLTGNELVATPFIANNLVNSSIVGNYFDPGTSDSQSLITLAGVIHIAITSNTFQSNGRASTIGVDFEPGPIGTSNVNLSSNVYIGDGNGATGGGYGIKFNDPSARNVYIGGESFRLLSAALYFGATLDRSTIDRFEARDVFYYAQNLPAHAGPYLRADSIYQKHLVHLFGYLAATVSSSTEIATANIAFPAMFSNPVPTITAVTGNVSTPCSPGVTVAGSNSTLTISPTSLAISLYAGSTAAAGYNGCDATVTLDNTLYVAPR